MRARYYDPVSARFLTPDSLWPRLSRPDALDPYQYALRNPLRYIDPAGKCEYSGSSPVAAGGLVFDTFAGGLIYAGNAAQGAADLANAEAASIAGKGANEIFDWYEGFANGTIAEESGAGDLVFNAYSEEEAVDLVNMMFGGTPGNPFAEGAGKNAIFTPQAELQAKKWWYSNLGEEVETLETEGAQLSQRASFLRTAGTGLAVVGITVQTGVAVYQDYHNGAGVVVTATDAASTISANAAIMAAPPLAAVDLVTGGAVSGGIHNALMTPNTVARVALGRVTTRDADAIKVTYTRFAVGQWAWYAGEYYADLIFGK